MSLSEFVASPVVEKVASNLPKPVAPVRRPVSLRDQPNTQQSHATVNPPQPQQSFPPQPINMPIPPQNVNPQPINRPQPINQQPPLQQWNQPVQPTIQKPKKTKKNHNHHTPNQGKNLKAMGMLIFQ